MSLAFINLLVGTNPVRGANQPNIILILTDDQGVDAVGGVPGYSNGLACHTPNLSTWASRGTVFRRVRVNPNCSPTRAGILTGRQAINTGVMGVNRGDREHRALTGMQGHETTIAELLRANGYDTIFVDKWHCGGERSLMQRPEQQGFDTVIPFRLDEVDDPLVLGDEYITYSVNRTVETIGSRPNTKRPYFLAFWTIDPHFRTPDPESGLDWWKVDKRLLPSGEDYYADDTNRNRYRAVIEALDTELGRMLYELGVVDGRQNYRPQSNTVVIFLGDNGTPQEASLRPEHAKRTLFEGGIRVPMVAFGQNVPRGVISPRLVSQVDLFDTFLDLAGIAVDNTMLRPRQSRSFAGELGWAANRDDDRNFTFSSLGFPDPEASLVAMGNDRFKLICKAGGVGLADPGDDQFYDLLMDPVEEANLVRLGMNNDQRTAYETMRNAIVDEWPTAVCQPLSIHVDLPLTDMVSINTRDEQSTDLGHLRPGEPTAIESRALLRFDTSHLEDRLPTGCNPADIVEAQIVLAFDRDAIELPQRIGTDTGVLRAFPMGFAWYRMQDLKWSDIAETFNSSAECGSFDPAPYIVPFSESNREVGLPMPSGTPISLGRSVTLRDLVLDWYEYPDRNNGIVIMADPDYELGGDQHLRLLPYAMLRLTVKRD